MRGISNPLFVDLISSLAEVFGVAVPIPTAPLEGNVFVCACKLMDAMPDATISAA
jgi:hypothetical protein